MIRSQGHEHTKIYMCPRCLSNGVLGCLMPLALALDIKCWMLRAAPACWLERRQVGWGPRAAWQELIRGAAC